MVDGHWAVVLMVVRLKSTMKAKAAADRMAALFFERKDEMWPDMMSIDEILDRAEDPAVPKQQRLYEQRDRHGNTCRVRAAERSDKRSSHRMAGRTAGKRDIEHHPKK